MALARTMFTLSSLCSPVHDKNEDCWGKVEKTIAPSIIVAGVENTSPHPLLGGKNGASHRTVNIGSNGALEF